MRNFIIFIMFLFCFFITFTISFTLTSGTIKKKMAKFYKECLGHQELFLSNAPICVEDCLELIENSEFRDVLIELFEIEEIQHDPIYISGLNEVIRSVLDRDNEFEKIDLDSHISKVSCIDSIDNNTIKLRFNDVEQLNGSFFDAKTVYSAKREYFEGFYKMDKFANFCISEGHFSLLQNNIDYLNERYQDSDSRIKNFRLLKNKEGEYFVRAITSTSSYNDYNIRFSLFVTIMALYNVTASTNCKFKISRCEYSESFIRIYFQKDGTSKISNIGNLSFTLEMTNDEIKREAFRLSGLFTLTSNSDNEETNIFLKPQNIKTKFISIKHSFKTSTVIEQLEVLADYIEDAEKEMREDIIELNKVENADHLRYFLLRKIEKSQKPGLYKFKTAIKEKLDTKINKINELILLMGKVDEIVTDLEVKEYLRYLFYEILRDKRKK